jgi:hypothetical protein
MLTFLECAPKMEDAFGDVDNLNFFNPPVVFSSQWTLIAVLWISSRLFTHVATGNRCLADRARIIALVDCLEDSASSIADLN